MPVKLDKFGPTASADIKTTDFINSKDVLAVPTDPRLQSLLANSRNANPQVSSTLPDGSKPTDKGNLNTIEQKIYQAVAQGNELASKITGPLQKFYSTVNDVNESIDAVKGVIGERGAIQRAINQAGQLVGIDVFSLKKENKYINQQLSSDGGVLAPLNYPYPRIAWEITTQWRLLQGQPSIKFYVNPASMTVGQTQIQQKDFVQKGYLMNNWKDINVESGNRFPMMDIGFDFQSSNILPESYVKTASEYSGINNSANALDILKQTVGINNEAINIDGEYKIPPGLLNFFDILTFFHEDKTISKLKMYSIPNSLNDNSPLSIADLSQIKTDELNPEIERLAGMPNYVYLSISTRIWPRMTLKGFFEGGYSINESASDPFKFSTQLKFSAFESDPAWWDPKAIRDAYLNFYKKASSKLGDRPSTELAPAVKESWVIPPDIYISAAQVAASKFAIDMAKPIEPLEELDSLPPSNLSSSNIPDDLPTPGVVNEEELKQALDNVTITQLNQQSNTAAFANLDLTKPFDANNLSNFTGVLPSATFNQSSKDATQIASEKSQLTEFENAFKKARQELGPNKIFEFKGKKYTTNYKEEENKQQVIPTPAATPKEKTIVVRKSDTPSVTPASNKKLPDFKPTTPPTVKNAPSPAPSPAPSNPAEDHSKRQKSLNETHLQFNGDKFIEELKRDYPDGGDWVIPKERDRFNRTNALYVRVAEYMKKYNPKAIFALEGASTNNNSLFLKSRAPESPTTTWAITVGVAKSRIETGNKSQRSSFDVILSPEDYKRFPIRAVFKNSVKDVYVLVYDDISYHKK